MKTQKEIEKELQELESLDCLKQPTATTDTNVVLALIQCHVEAKIAMLKWVLRK